MPGIEAFCVATALALASIYLLMVSKRYILTVIFTAYVLKSIIVLAPHASIYLLMVSKRYISTRIFTSYISKSIILVAPCIYLLDVIMKYTLLSA
jgi:hypothetical protein